MSNTKTRLRRVIGGSAVVTLAGATVLAAAIPATAATGPTINRVWGQDRYETAAAVATAAFPSGAGTAIIVNGEAGHFPDALSANYLAGALHAPILLSTTSSVPTTTMNELKSLNVKNVYLVGGTGVLTSSVMTQLKGAGYNVVGQLGGADRYATDQLVAESTAATVGTINGLKTAIVARGDIAADALSAGALAYAKGLPVILTTSGSLSTTASAIINDLGIQQVIVVGGTGAVSTTDLTALAALTSIGGSSHVLTPAQGTDRSDTSQLLAQWEVANVGFSTTRFAVASGETGHEVDALAGGPYAGTNNEPILVTYSVSSAGKDTVFASLHPTVTQIDVIGGTGAVADSAATAIQTAVTAGTAGTYTVAPAGAANVDQGKSQQYTVTGLGTTPVDVQLFDCGDLSVSNGVATFTNGNGTATNNFATSTVSANDQLTVVNGAPVTGSIAKGITPQNGSITFSVTNGANGNAASSCVVPVVFQQGAAGAANQDQLQLGANNAPIAAQAYGVGGMVTFAPAQAATGFYNVTVDSVDTAANTFVGHTGSGSSANYYTFTFNVAGSSYAYDETPGGQGSTNPLPISATQFASYLSAGDTLSVAYGTATTPSSISYTVTNGGGDVPAAPTAVAGAYQPAVTTGTATHPNQVHVTWTAPPNPDVYQYKIDVATVNSSGVVGAFAPLATVTGTKNAAGVVTSAPNAYYDDTSEAAGTTVVYRVTAVADPNNSSLPSTASATSSSVTVPAAATTPTTPVSVSTAESPASGATTLVSGDALQVTFDQGVTLGTTPTLTLSDGNNSATLTSGTNATFALSNGNKTLTITVTGNVFSSGTALKLADLEVTGQSGITNAQGAWNLAASGYGTTNTRVFGGSNADITTPAAPTITGATTGAASTANVTVTCSGTDTVTAYNALGVALGTGTCASGTVTISSNAAIAASDVLYATQMAGANGYVSRSDKFTVGSSTGTVTGVTANPTSVTVASGAGADSTITASATGTGNVTFTTSSSASSIATCSITGNGNSVPVSGGTASTTLHVTWVATGSATCTVVASLNGNPQSTTVSVTAS